MNPALMSHRSAASRLLPRRSMLRITTVTAVVGLLGTGLVGPVDMSAWADAAPETVLDEIAAFEAKGDGVGGRANAVGVAAPVESEVLAAPMPFTMLGFEHPAGAQVEFRTSDGTEWSAWQVADAMGAEDGPDRNHSEATRAARSSAITPGKVPTEPMWTGEATHVQIRVSGASPADIGATVIDSDGVSRSLVQRVRDGLRPRIRPEAAEAAAPVPVISRVAWGADESIRKGRPSYAKDVRYGVVHHTAGTNTYSEAQAAGVVRGIYSYHTRTLGWSDIGYNVLVDRFGRIYEGRFGGLGRGVIGAHAQGFNTGSFGVSIMGDFSGSAQAPAVARTAVAEVVAWQFQLHGIVPNETITVRSAGSNKHAAGTDVRLNTLSGHRDVGQTACPANLYAQLGSLRSEAASLMGAPVPEHQFSDVESSRYYHRPISWMAHSGITNGVGDTGNFEPMSAVTRGQAVAFLWRLAGQPQVSDPHGFPDVSNRRYYAPAVRWAKANGITDGYGDTGLFEPDLPVTRGEIASFQWRALGRPTGEPAHGFPDVAPRSHYEVPLQVLRAHGITDGFGSTGLYEPGRLVLRGELSAMMYRSAGSPPLWRNGVPPPSAMFRVG